MKPGGIELRWAYVAFGLLASIDVLVGLRIVRRVIWQPGTAAPDVPVLVLLLLALHVVLLWLFKRVRNMVRYDQHLRAMYEQELNFAQQLLDASTEGLVMFSTEGRITYVNRRAAEVLGHPPEALLGLTSFQLVQPEDYAASEEQWLQSWSRSGEVYRMRIRGAQGEWRQVRVTVSPRWHQGRMVGSFGSVCPDDAPPL
ncbi:PAS domain-containing protein [Deinococcus wulumuqiensis]|uniref:PAS domain-containing protein n=1 Tax=Deinococcus wulumuqiensis TaxID=980427 RepID=A0AAV4K8G4_9DEIO|nr:PAS domain-containing protein [Deinococcus wulumuqiensis]QII21670.1 PAS domain S-box protein [Deinococcus wulumuqiensis R12]GGI69807.1 hypothetical protein GCM10008021_32410 [Deinococcus wulumuqiensis]GGI95356.1 hypothetical protein GCM10010914_32260 [Deinococcus wulumuqiensis]